MHGQAVPNPRVSSDHPDLTSHHNRPRRPRPGTPTWWARTPSSCSCRCVCSIDWRAGDGDVRAIIELIDGHGLALRITRAHGNHRARWRRRGGSWRRPSAWTRPTPSRSSTRHVHAVCLSVSIVGVGAGLASWVDSTVKQRLTAISLSSTSPPGAHRVAGVRHGHGARDAAARHRGPCMGRVR